MPLSCFSQILTYEDFVKLVTYGAYNERASYESLLIEINFKTDTTYKVGPFAFPVYRKSHILVITQYVREKDIILITIQTNSYDQYETVRFEAEKHLPLIEDDEPFAFQNYSGGGTDPVMAELCFLELT